jgi:hypothetical protein
MTLSNTGSVLATLTQLTQLNRTSVLTHRVKDLIRSRIHLLVGLHHR